MKKEDFRVFKTHQGWKLMTSIYVNGGDSIRDNAPEEKIVEKAVIKFECASTPEEAIEFYINNHRATENRQKKSEARKTKGLPEDIAEYAKNNFKLLLALKYKRPNDLKKEKDIDIYNKYVDDYEGEL